MIKFIHTADLHFGIKKYGRINPQTGLNTRIEEDFEQFDKVVKYAIKSKCSLFLIAGDVFDKRRPEDIIVREFAKRLKELINNSIITVVLMGNHDGVSAKDTAHCLSAINELNESKLLHIVDKPQVLELENILIACLPYVKKNEYINFLLKKGKPVILLGHAVVNGVDLNGYKLTNGLSPLSYNHKQIIYRAFGHIHNRQVVGKYIYSGSINRINFGDEQSIKGFIVGKIKNKKCKCKFVQLKSREFLTINEKWSEGLKKRLKQIDINNKIVKLNLKDETGVATIPSSNIKNFLIESGAIVDSINIIREVKEKIRDKNYKNKLDPVKLLKYHLRDEHEKLIKRGINILKKVTL